MTQIIDKMWIDQKVFETNDGPVKLFGSIKNLDSNREFKTFATSSFKIIEKNL
jgi:hypothetical protein